MIKVKTSANKGSHGFQVGGKVHVRFGPTKRTAQIVEDRGPIGVGGRHIYRVRLVRPTGEFQATFEVPIEQVSAIPRTPRILPAVKKYRM